MACVSEEEAIRSVLAAVAVQAINDWKALCYGAKETIRWSGDTVWGKEVYEFLVSPEFASIVSFVCPGISVSAMDDKLKLKQARIQMYGDQQLTEDERAVLSALANAGMSITRAAEICNCSRSTVARRMTNIRGKTGVDPSDFWGLNHLLTLMADEEGEHRDEKKKERSRH